MVGLLPGKSFALVGKVETADQLLKTLLNASSRPFELKGKKKNAGKSYSGQTHMEKNISYLTQHFTVTHGLKQTKKFFTEAKSGYGFFYVLVKNAKKPEENLVAHALLHDFINSIQGKVYTLVEKLGKKSLVQYDKNKNRSTLKLIHKITFLGDFKGIFNKKTHSDPEIITNLTEKLKGALAGVKSPGIGIALDKKSNKLKPTTKAVLILYISDNLLKEIRKWEKDPSYSITAKSTDVLPISFAPRAGADSGKAEDLRN